MLFFILFSYSSFSYHFLTYIHILAQHVPLKNFNFRERLVNIQFRRIGIDYRIFYNLKADDEQKIPSWIELEITIVPLETQQVLYVQVTDEESPIYLNKAHFRLVRTSLKNEWKIKLLPREEVLLSAINYQISMPCSRKSIVICWTL